MEFTTNNIELITEQNYSKLQNIEKCCSFYRGISNLTSDFTNVQFYKKVINKQILKVLFLQILPYTLSDAFDKKIRLNMIYGKTPIIFIFILFTETFCVPKALQIT